MQAGSWLLWWTLDFSWRLRGLRSWESPEFCTHWQDLSREREIWQSGCFYFTATCTSISPALSEGMFLPCVGEFHLWYFPHNLVPELELHLVWDIPPFSKTSLSWFLSCHLDNSRKKWLNEFLLGQLCFACCSGISKFFSLHSWAAQAFLQIAASSLHWWHCCWKLFMFCSNCCDIFHHVLLHMEVALSSNLMTATITKVHYLVVSPNP